MRLRPFATLLIVLALAAPAWAQETRGAIEGVIKDTSGAVLPGATVEAKSAMGVVSTTADETGAYRFPALSPGRYKIVATLQGFKPAATKVTVVVGQQLQAISTSRSADSPRTVSVTATRHVDRHQAERGGHQHPGRDDRAAAEGPRLPVAGDPRPGCQQREPQRRHFR